MKITKNYLRNIIKEEVDKCLNEGILDKIKGAFKPKPVAKKAPALSPSKQKLLDHFYIKDLTKRFPDFKRDVDNMSDEDAYEFASWLHGEVGTRTLNIPEDEWMKDWHAASRTPALFMTNKERDYRGPGSRSTWAPPDKDAEADAGRTRADLRAMNSKTIAGMWADKRARDKKQHDATVANYRRKR